jgi:ribosomal RNA assembly protein
MSEDKIDMTDAAGDAPPVINKNKRYRMPKPWDNDPTLDKFIIEEFKPEDNPHGGVVDESCFSVLFP